MYKNVSFYTIQWNSSTYSVVFSCLFESRYWVRSSYIRGTKNSITDLSFREKSCQKLTGRRFIKGFILCVSPRKWLRQGRRCCPTKKSPNQKPSLSRHILLYFKISKFIFNLFYLDNEAILPDFPMSIPKYHPHCVSVHNGQVKETL